MNELNKDPYMDPYMYKSQCLARLLDEYNKHKSLIIAVDHDDTVFDFHKKGYTYEKTIEIVKKCKESGFYIVLFTACSKDRWKEMNEWWLENIGFKPDSVNKNPIELPFGNDGKIYYNILLDDRAGLNSSLGILDSFFRIIKSEK